MLTKKQQRKLDKMVENYSIGVNKRFNFHWTVIARWVYRYRVRMEQVLQKQGKR